jgi:hypothetical protein
MSFTYDRHAAYHAAKSRIKPAIRKIAAKLKKLGATVDINIDGYCQIGAVNGEHVNLIVAVVHDSMYGHLNKLYATVRSVHRHLKTVTYPEGKDGFNIEKIAAKLIEYATATKECREANDAAEKRRDEAAEYRTKLMAEFGTNEKVTLNGTRDNLHLVFNVLSEQQVRALMATYQNTVPDDK